MMRRTAAAACLLVAAFLMPGCSDAPTDAPAVQVRDSAGIRVVDHSERAWTSYERWTLSREPLVEIGVLEGPEEYQFFRVTDATRLADGRILVIDAGSGELRLFTPEGRFLSSTGRKGEGPGEFGFPARLGWVRGDSLAVWDAHLQRVSLFGPELDFGRQVPVENVLNPNVLGFYDDGSFVLAELWFDVSDPGYTEVPIRFYLNRLDRAAVDTLGESPYGYFKRFEEVDLASGPLFSPLTSMSFLPRGYAVGLKRQTEIEIYDRSGTLRRLVRWPDRGREVTEQDVADHTAEELASMPDARRQAWARHYRDVEVAEKFPAHGQLVSDRMGNLWVEEYRKDWRASDSLTHWRILGPGGRLRARIAVPDGIRLLDIGADEALVLHRDDLDVESIRAYRILK